MSKQNPVSPGKRYKIHHRDDWKCWYCGIDVIECQDNFSEVRKWASIDHLHPKSLGGTHTPDNLVTSCRACNSKKQTKTLEEFRIYTLSKTYQYQAFAAIKLAQSLTDSCPDQFEIILKALESQIPKIVFWGERDLAEREAA